MKKPNKRFGWARMMQLALAACFAGVLLLTPVGEAIAYITSSTANVVNTFIGETATCDETKDTTSEPDASSDDTTAPDETKDTSSEPDVSSDEPTTSDETKDTTSEPDVSSDEPTIPEETTGAPSEPDDSSDESTGPYEEAPQTGVEDPLEIFLYILVMTVSVAVFCTMQYCIKHSRDSEKGRREK